MKNSLFKRVFATVASVPLALSQCLTYTSYAVTNDSVQSTAENTESSEKEVYTLKDNLLYIAPGQTESTWYSAFYAELVAIGNKNNNKANTIAKETIANAILNHSGKYSGKAQLVIDMLSEDGVQYTISNNGDITVTGKIVNPDLSAFMDAGKVISLDDSMKELAEKYGAPEIAEADFSSVDFSGTYEVVIEGSDLANGYTMDVKAKYTANTAVNGKTVFAAGDAGDFALAKFNEIKAIAYASIDSANLPADVTAKAKADFDSKFSKYEGWINKANNNKDKVYTVERSASSPNMKSLIETINDYIDNGKYSDKIDKVEDKFNREINIPATVTDIMNNSYVADLYDVVMNEINKISVNYNIDITTADIASFADNDLYGLTATAKQGTYTLTGDFPDDEVADSVKHMVATVEVGDIYNADDILATVGLRIYRDPVTTTSTTSSTTTTDSTTTTTTTVSTDSETETTTTTTVTSETETGTETTTTETSATGSETGTETTTTETSATGSETGTETVTTETSATGSETGTETVTTETSATGSETGTGTVTTETSATGSETGTGTVTTETSATGSETGTGTVTTETSATGSETGTETTTTGSGSGLVLAGEVESLTVSVETASYGFYYSYEEEFHKDQVGDNLVLHITYVDEDLADEDKTIDFGFASTPNEMFTVGDEDFKYDAVLTYAGPTVSDSTGKVVLTEGDALKTADGSDASVEVYIGYLGDVNLDYYVDAVDGTQVLTYYAVLSTGGTVDTAQLGYSDLIDGPTSIYDDFAAFLGDPNQSDVGEVKDNWKATKADRMVDANDATAIQMYYSLLATEDEFTIGDRDGWDEIFNS
ncbi:MAG: hypothetical protein NC177_12125 [Ruminococcus flavefaciens]|nr:hypothetical protein [Ruminococcus flavefaciens]